MNHGIHGSHGNKFRIIPCIQCIPWLKISLILIASMGLLAAAIPDDSTVERLRKQIEERQQQRRDAASTAQTIELHELGTTEEGWPDLNKPGDLAVIRLIKESSLNPLAVRLVPIGRDLEPIQIPSWGRGDQWICLDPGRWRLELSGRSGLRPDSGTEKTDQPLTFQLTLDRRGRYELPLDRIAVGGSIL